MHIRITTKTSHPWDSSSQSSTSDTNNEDNTISIHSQSSTISNESQPIQTVHNPYNNPEHAPAPNLLMRLMNTLQSWIIPRDPIPPPPSEPPIPLVVELLLTPTPPTTEPDKSSVKAKMVELTARVRVFTSSG